MRVGASIMQNLMNPKSFPSVPRGLREIQFHGEGKTKTMDCFGQKCKTASLFQHFAENTSLPTAQLGPEQNIFLFMHLTLPCVCRLARLSLMHLFVGEGRKNTCISLSQLNCSEALPSRTGQMWGRDLQKTTPSLSPHSSLHINLCLSRRLQSSSESHSFLSAAKGIEEGRDDDEEERGKKTKSGAAALCVVRCRSGATCVVHHALTYRQAMRWHRAIQT